MIEDMEDSGKVVVIFIIAMAFILALAISFNVIANYSCKSQAIQAGMTSTQVQEACK